MIPHYSNPFVLVLSENVIKQTNKFAFTLDNYIVALEAKKDSRLVIR